MEKSFGKVLIFIALSILLIMCVFPFLIVLATSLSNENRILLEGCGILPKGFELKTYEYLFKNSTQIVNSYKTTITVTLIGTLVGMFMQSGIAYCLSRADFMWKKQVSFFVYFTMLFSGGLVPTYILITQYLHLKDTIWVLIIPMLCSGWNIFLLRTYFQTMPVSLIEAAQIDGANEYYIFFKIALPITKTGIATVTLFIMLGYWNEWFLSMLYISKNTIISLQYLLNRMILDASFINKAQGAVGGSFGTGTITTIPLRMATCVIAAGPMILAFPFFQKYFVRGITIGSVKG